VTSANSLHAGEPNPSNDQALAEIGEGAIISNNGPPAAVQRVQTTKPSKIRVLFGRVLGDGLLAYTIYAFLFVGLFNSGTNVLQVGREILISIHPEQDPNRDLVRFIGIVTISVICLIQLFSSRAGRVLNRFFAIVKILFLVVLFFFGVGALTNNDPPSDFTQKQQHIPPIDYSQAILVVLYSYEGWENANFVRSQLELC
jgi:amino acid transporter